MSRSQPSAASTASLQRIVRSRWSAGVLIVAATIAAYSNSFRGEFVFDDFESIPRNLTIRNLWPLGPVLAPPSAGGRTVAGRPVVNFSLAINYALSRTDVWSYHALNLAVHVLASLVLWGIVRRTLQLPVIPESLRAAASSLALITALVWAVHPLTTAAVTYVVQRAESMMALFYLLTLYCVIRAATSERRALWYSGAIVAAAFGMATKEVMVTAPLIVLLYDRTFVAGSFRRALRSRWALYTGLAVTWIIPIVLWGGRAASAGFRGPIGVWPYALTQIDFVTHYLGLCFWPHPLIFDYGTSLVHDFRPVLPQAALVAALLIGTALALWRRPALGFLGACFFLILAPSSSFVPVSTQTGAEHRMYLPLAAVIVLAALLAYAMWRRWMVRVVPQPTARRGIAATLMLALAAILADVTFQRNAVYRSGVSLWSDTVAKRPDNPRAHYNLGRHLVDAGELVRAGECFQRTVAAQPDYPDAYLNLGCTRARLDRHEEALADFGRALEMCPENAENYYNRALSYQALGRFEAALADCTAALARNARHAQAYYTRGLARQKLDRTADALADYSAAIQIDPTYAAPFGERAISYFMLKRFDDAWADVREFRRLGGTPNPVFIERLTRASGHGE